MLSVHGCTENAKRTKLVLRSFNHSSVLLDALSTCFHCSDACVHCWEDSAAAAQRQSLLY